LHHDVGYAAAEALARFGAPAIKILSEALNHPEPSIRLHAVFGLGKIQDVRVAPLLIEMVKDPDRSVQKQAIQSLGQLQDEHALSALRVIAADRSDRELSMIAKRFLEDSLSS
jgi:HEAT repeat protein